MLLSGGEDPKLSASFTRRGLLLGAGQLALLGGLAYRLHALQVGDTSRYQELAESNRMTAYRTPPERGRLLDRFGTVLADNEAIQRVSVVPYLAGDVGQLLVRLSKVVAITDNDADRILLLARKQNPRLPILIAGGLTWEQVARINLLAPEMPGLQTETGYERRYFHGTAMGQIVGHIGSPDRQAVEERCEPADSRHARGTIRGRTRTGTAAARGAGRHQIADRGQDPHDPSGRGCAEPGGTGRRPHN